MLFKRILSFIFIAAVIFSCGRSSTDQVSKIPVQGRFPFNELKGIYFQEARRSFKNGLSFNEMGFEQEPSWDIVFKTDDTVQVLYPETQTMFDFYLHYDHDQVYNFAKEWFRLISISKDSLIFQRLEVKSREIKSGIESDVYMKFYAKNYIKDSLKTTIEKLRAPSARDTAYVKEMVKWMNTGKDITHEKYFAAKNPPVLESYNPNITVKKLKKDYGFAQKSAVYEYLYPEYDVTIHHAFKDFSYSFAALVDVEGNFILNFFQTVPEFQAPREKLIQRLLDGYLENSIKVTPGKTLGIPQRSMIYINLRGNKNG